MAEQRFKPVIWVKTEDGAHSFLIAMLEQKLKTLRFENGFETLPKPEQLVAVQERVREHFNETGGSLHGFGKILGYRYANTSETSIILDTDGNVINEHGGPFSRSEVAIELR